MDRIIILLLLSLTGLLTYGQNPVIYSDIFKLDEKQIPEITLAGFDNERLLANELANEKLKIGRYNFSKNYEVNYTLENAGRWTVLESGDRIWQLNIKSIGAVSLNFALENFYLPDGASLYLYSSKGATDGPYNSKDNSSTKKLSTWVIPGESCVIELYEPKAVIGKSEFQISLVGHGFRSFGLPDTKAINESQTCEYDVDCAIGDGWEVQKRGVNILLINGSAASGFCTGGLINNTSENRTPYILSAYHCFEGLNINSTYNVAARFRWKAQNPLCPKSAGSSFQDPNYYQASTGLTVRSLFSGSDLALLQIPSAIPNTQDVCYLGWDRTTNIPQSATGIHHPSGDLMKISVENNPLNQGNVTIESQTAACWIVNNWDYGVTEGGSSGSPLFNSDGRIIGQLFVFFFACIGVNDNGQNDLYGRLNVSWNGGGSNTSRLSNWLDPTNSGNTTLPALCNVLSTSDLNSNALNEIKIYPNPASNQIFIKGQSFKEAYYQIFDSSGKLVQKGINEYEQPIEIDKLISEYYIISIEIEGNNVTRKFIVKK